MKSSNNNPLEVAEYFSIGISIIGSIVASGLGQIMYATTPLFLTLFLSILNRSRLHQVQQNTLAEVNRLDKLQLAQNRLHQSIQQNTLAEVNQLEKLQLDLNNLAIDEVNRLEKSIEQTQDNNNRAFTEVGQRIQNIPQIDSQIESLISHLNQLSKKQSIFQEKSQKNINIALHEVGVTIEKITEISKNIISLNRQINEINNKINAQSNTKIISQINQKIVEIEIEIDNLRNQLKPSIETIHTQVDKKIELIESKIREVNQNLENKLDNSKKLINNRFDKDISAFNKSLEPLLQTTQKIISQQVDNSKYELIYKNSGSQLINDRHASREELYEALKKAEKRIIMVCPWITCWGFSNYVENLTMEALIKNVEVYIGWGYSGDINKIKKENLGISSTKISEKLQTQSLYKAVHKLIDLQKKHNNLHLKLIGTHEKFLICDESWALITSHNFLASGVKQDEREIGLWTNDKKIINDLIQRYQSAISL